MRKANFTMLVMTFFAMLFTLNANAQCTLACNDNVQVSIVPDALGNCTTTITPDMILENFTAASAACAGPLTVEKKVGTNWVPATVNSSNINQTIQVRVKDAASGNTCWGYILVEDKVGPTIECAENITISCAEQAPATAVTAPTIVDCSATSWTVVETNQDLDCTGAFSYIKTRKYTATDAQGFTAVCTMTISFERAEMTDVVFPADVTLNQCAPSGAAPLAGTPTVNGANLYPNNTFCEMNTTFTDQLIPVCTGTVKVLRTWTVADWCTGEIASDIQIIKYLDAQAPTIGDNANVTISTGSSSCTGSYAVSLPTASDLCSSATVTASAAAGTFVNGGSLLINLPVGLTVVTYTASDACGNTATSTQIITVEDQTAPTPVCKEITQVALGSDGTAIIYAASFDNGSHDNCGPVTLSVRRMGNALPCDEDNATFDESVKFCCDNIGATNLQVMLRVTDAQNNKNTCMVNVLVEDKLAPTCIAPANVTVFCDDQVNGAPINLWNTEVFGQPSFYDNCGFDTTYVRTWNLDNCGKGSITRSWSVKDQGNLTDNCSQTITVGSHSDFVVNFPEDVTFNNCDLGNVPGATIFDDECELVAVNVEDVQYDVVPDACFKIIRTYTVINWCVYDPNATTNNPGGAVLNAAQHIWRDGVNFGNNFGYGNGAGTSDGYMKYSQVIKVNDTNKPTITSACEDVTFNDYSNGCDGFASLSITATDACTQAGDLEYRWFIYPNGNLTGAPLSGTGASVSGEYPYGTHIIKWEVEDGCGNKSFCDYTFTVRDAKAPTIVCLNGLAANLSLMDTNGDGTGDQGMVEIWDNEFFDSWGDNCTPNAQLKLAVCKSCNTMPNTKAVTFDCDDLGPQQVRLWVQDAAGNAAYCETFVDIQDNSGICTTAAATIAGTIVNEDNETVANVAVSANAGSSLPTATATTGQNGAFLLNNLTGASYNVSAAKNNDPLNGVTTYDIVLISKHILGVQTLNSPYKMIAADVNKSNSISAYDMVELRKLILHVTEQFSNNSSWRFVPATFAFANPANPFQYDFPESMNVTPGSEADFTAVKVGDVNGNATTNNLLGAAVRNEVGTLTLTADNNKLVAGQEYTVNFKGSEAAGFQFTLNFDKNALEVVSVSNEENFGIFADAVTASFNNANTFAITFRANTNVELASALSINSRITTAEAYNNEGELMNVALQFNGAAANVAGANFELFQNTPNPFKGETTIGFNMPQAGAATLTIFDAAGRTIKTVNGDFAKGYNAVTVSELNATGVLYYQLDSNNDSATKMMIIAE